MGAVIGGAYACGADLKKLKRRLDAYPKAMLLNTISSIYCPAALSAWSEA